MFRMATMHYLGPLIVSHIGCSSGQNKLTNFDTPTTKISAIAFKYASDKFGVPLDEMMAVKNVCSAGESGHIFLTDEPTCAALAGAPSKAASGISGAVWPTFSIVFVDFLPFCTMCATVCWRWKRPCQLRHGV